MKMAAKQPCPQVETHTKAPIGYVAWHEWAALMTQTHRCRRCRGCGLFKRWTRVYTPPTKTKETADAS